MKLDSRLILQKNRLSPWRIVLITVATIAALTGLTWHGGLDRYVQQKLLWPINFQARQFAGRGAKLSNSVRVFSVDDSTVTYLQRSFLNVDEWASRAHFNGCAKT